MFPVGHFALSYIGFDGTYRFENAIFCSLGDKLSSIAVDYDYNSKI